MTDKSGKLEMEDVTFSNNSAGVDDAERDNERQANGRHRTDRHTATAAYLLEVDGWTPGANISMSVIPPLSLSRYDDICSKLLLS